MMLAAFTQSDGSPYLFGKNDRQSKNRLTEVADLFR